jgi:rubrerythrin
MSHEELIHLLNAALSSEFADLFAYPRDAEIICDGEVSEIFQEFGRMEMRHADMLGMQIIALGGDPDWDPLLPERHEALTDILKAHARRERAAIKHYDQLIGMLSGDGHEELKIIVRGIQAEERLHLDTIEDLLNEQTNGGSLH